MGTVRLCTREAFQSRAGKHLHSIAEGHLRSRTLNVFTEPRTLNVFTEQGQKAFTERREEIFTVERGIL